MPSHSHGLVKIVVSNADILAPYTLSDMQMSCVCRRQARFSVLGPKEVDCVHVTILLSQVGKVPFESRLRRLRTRDLNFLAKCL
jgi:hypothetical protein